MKLIVDLVTIKLGFWKTVQNDGLKLEFILH